LEGSVNNTQPVVTITADATAACNNSPITFIATNVSGSKDVSFNWLIDGTDVVNNNDTFVVRGIYRNTIIKCIMSAPACKGSWSSVSNEIHIATYDALTPSVSIGTHDTSVCEGREAVFEAAAEKAGSNPFYQWKINGINAGSNSSQFTTRTLKDGDVISCTLIADTSQHCYTSP
jgi:hypothetical protein